MNRKKATRTKHYYTGKRNYHLCPQRIVFKRKHLHISQDLDTSKKKYSQREERALRN